MHVATFTELQHKSLELSAPTHPIHSLSIAITQPLQMPLSPLAPPTTLYLHPSPSLTLNLSLGYGPPPLSAQLPSPTPTLQSFSKPPMLLPSSASHTLYLSPSPSLTTLNLRLGYGLPALPALPPPLSPPPVSHLPPSICIAPTTIISLQ